MTGPLPKVLTTTRLILRPWQESDHASFSAMAADPEVMAHLLPLTSPQAITGWIHRQQTHLAENGFCLWAMASKESGELMGAAGLMRISYKAHFSPAVEVGWRLARRFWGKGYAPEAAGAALQFGFEHMGLTEIVANTVPSNHNSRRVMEKLGMSNDPADDFDHPLVPEGNPLRRQMLYRLPRRDWSVQRRS
jgi:RimJ/RimL family protein N-acetyltransferase